MKTVLLILSLCVLVGCGKAGSTTASAGEDPTGPNLDPSCKQLGDTWRSTSDQEEQDFSQLTLNDGASAYNWISGTGFVCNQSAEIYSANASTTAAGFHYEMEFHNTNPSNGCEFWQDGSGPSTNHGSAVVKLECNKITLCKTKFANNGECKEYN